MLTSSERANETRRAANKPTTHDTQDGSVFTLLRAQFYTTKRVKKIGVATPCTKIPG